MQEKNNFECEMPISVSLEKAMLKEHRRFVDQLKSEKGFKSSSKRNKEELLRLVPTVLASAMLMCYLDRFVMKPRRMRK